MLACCVVFVVAAFLLLVDLFFLPFSVFLMNNRIMESFFIFSGRNHRSQIACSCRGVETLVVERQGCRGYGMGIGTVMNPHRSLGILWGFLNGCEIKRKRVKYATNVMVDV